VATQEMDEEQAKPGEKDSHVKEMQQQLKKAQHIIAQFYQENRELKRKLTEKTLEEKTPQSKAGPMEEMSKGRKIRQSPKATIVSKSTSPLTRSSTRKSSPDIQGKQATSQKSPPSPTEGEKNIRWMNKQLREAQGKIIKLREERRLLDDRAMRHFKECILSRENACATLSNAQSKLKRNAALLRQVGNLKRQNLSLRKANRALRLQVKLNKEAKDRLNLLAEVA
jgi:hypothetical protein